MSNSTHLYKTSHILHDLLLEILNFWSCFFTFLQGYDFCMMEIFTYPVHQIMLVQHKKCVKTFLGIHCIKVKEFACKISIILSITNKAVTDV